MCKIIPVLFGWEKNTVPVCLIIFENGSTLKHSILSIMRPLNHLKAYPWGKKREHHGGEMTDPDDDRFDMNEGVYAFLF